METKPSVLLLSCSKTRPASLMKLITKQGTDHSDADLLVQPWTISTKYYTSEINLVGFHGSPADFRSQIQQADLTESLVIHFDANQENGLDDVSKWTKMLDELMDPEVKLLLTNCCNESTAVSKREANLWCLDKGFELVELIPDAQNEEDSDEDDFGKETTGIDRVVEALQNHLWSNMVTHDDAELENDKFLELFSNLMSMKSSISSLPSAERKQCAEQVVTAFWNAIGGDDEDVADL